MARSRCLAAATCCAASVEETRKSIARAASTTTARTRPTGARAFSRTLRRGTPAALTSLSLSLSRALSLSPSLRLRPTHRPTLSPALRPTLRPTLTPPPSAAQKSVAARVGGCGVESQGGLGGLRPHTQTGRARRAGAGLLLASRDAHTDGHRALRPRCREPSRPLPRCFHHRPASAATRLPPAPHLSAFPPPDCLTLRTPHTGGAMTSLMDDLCGHICFVAAEAPWCGATVQVSSRSRK